MRLLVLTTEPLPLPGLPTTGAGLRAWGLGFGLRSAGFDDVRMAFAADAIRGLDVDTSIVPGVFTFERGKLGEFIEEQKPDAIVLQHWGMASALPEVHCPLAIDLAGPHLLERQLWGSKDLAGDLREKVAALARADHVVCSGEFQRHYFLPFLFQAGFDPGASAKLCPVIPFSVSPSIPTPADDRDLSAFVYSGFFLPWQDPSNALDWTLETLDERDKGKLIVVGGAHPGGDVSGGRYDALLAKLDAHERVERHGVMPFERLLDLMRHSGTAIDLMPRNPERELAFPTRTMFFLWAGLPVIHNDYDELAEPIDRAKAGWVLDPNDKDKFQQTVKRLVGHSEDVARRGQNAQDLVREKYTWDKTIEPLAAWCRDPHRREGKRPVTVSVPTVPASATERKERKKRRARKGQVTYSPPPPVAGPNRLQQVLSPLALLVALPIALVLGVFFGLAELTRIVTKR